MEPVRDALAELLRKLYKRPEVKIVKEYRLEAAPSADFGLSAELHNGAVVDFWVELWAADAAWELTYYVARHDPDEDGSHVEVEFPGQLIHSVTNMSATLVEALKALERASASDDLYR